MLTLIRGLPGSGKSTFAKRYYPNILHLENDMFCMYSSNYVFDREQAPKIHDQILKIVEQNLKLTDGKMDMIISCVFAHKKSIMKFSKLAKKYKCDFKVIRLTSDFGNNHNVPLDVLESMKNSFEDWEGEEIKESLSEYPFYFERESLLVQFKMTSAILTYNNCPIWEEIPLNELLEYGCITRCPFSKNNYKVQKDTLQIYICEKMKRIYLAKDITIVIDSFEKCS